MGDWSDTFCLCQHSFINGHPLHESPLTFVPIWRINSTSNLIITLHINIKTHFHGFFAHIFGAHEWNSCIFVFYQCKYTNSKRSEMWRIHFLYAVITVNTSLSPSAASFHHLLTLIIITSASLESCFCIFQDTVGSGCQQLCDCCFMSALKPSFREAPVRRTLCTAMIASLAAS